MGKPLTLLFDPFESIVLFLSVLTVAFCIGDGKSNWLEGMILMSLYVILVCCLPPFWWRYASLMLCLCGYIGCCILVVSCLVSPIRPHLLPRY